MSFLTTDYTDEVMHPTPLSLWIQRVIYVFAIAFCTMGFLVMLSLFWREFLNSPPIQVKSLNPTHLGVLCPGDVSYIENTVSINDDIIVHYFISTMDAEGKLNHVGTQQVYTDFLHPFPTTFYQKLEWRVPDLPPGDYMRVFAVRKVSGDEDTVFVTTLYSIGEC